MDHATGCEPDSPQQSSSIAPTATQSRPGDAPDGIATSAHVSTTMAVAGPALTVFYDGGCPLCRREIDFYRRRRGAGRIDWLDVSTCEGAVVATDLCRSDALARFHVRLPDGRLASGGPAFAELWCALPDFRWVGRIARAPGIVSVLEVAYRAFLRLRPTLQRVARKRGSRCVAAGDPR